MAISKQREALSCTIQSRLQRWESLLEDRLQEMAYGRYESLDESTQKDRAAEKDWPSHGATDEQWGDWLQKTTNIGRITAEIQASLDAVARIVAEDNLENGIEVNEGELRRMASDMWLARSHKVTSRQCKGERIPASRGSFGQIAVRHPTPLRVILTPDAIHQLVEDITVGGEGWLILLASDQDDSSFVQASLNKRYSSHHWYCDASGDLDVLTALGYTQGGSDPLPMKWVSPKEIEQVLLDTLRVAFRMKPGDSVRVGYEIAGEANS
jgi:hypothetical protein